MITHLSISNYALIDQLDIDFNDSFSVITGETGAGKSIILGAISLLLGQRADARLIKPGEKRCVIEAHFNLSRYELTDLFASNDIDYDTEDTILRREFSVAGKSRAFVNDSPVSLSIMKEIGEHLVDIHSQHQNLLLGEEDFQLNVVDIMAGLKQEIDSYQSAYNVYRSLVSDYEKVKREIETNKLNEDFLQFQYNELIDADLSEGEQESLEEETLLMENAESIKTSLNEVNILLSGDDGCLERLHQSQRQIQNILTFVDRLTPISERLDSCYVELKDIAGEIDEVLEQVDFDPQRLTYNHERLDLIYRLQKKYQAESVEQLITVRDNLEKTISKITDSDAYLEEKRLQMMETKTKCENQARSISKKRHTVAKSMEKAIVSKLSDLGIENAQFEISFQEKSLDNDGIDKLDFRFSANKNMPLQTISNVASGGEIARVMLAIKAMISGTVKLPTIIFDEIDTGVSGKAAEQMATIMEQMAQNGRQVISITHLPQIAAKGSTHYRVYKENTIDGTRTQMTMLNDEERVNEIAQMLSGTSISKAAMDNAKQLINKQ